MRSVCFKTIGCRLNQAETATIAGGFEAAGYEVVPFDNGADVCVIHTCTITANAERTCLRTARSFKKQHPCSLVVLAGCAVETSRQRLLADPSVDMVADQLEKLDLPRILRAPPRNHSLPALVPPPASDPAVSAHSRNRTARPPRFETTRALLKVQDGCDFRCAYCIVPDTRGAPTSLPFDTIIEQARMLADAGYRELGLTGANLGCYNDNGRDLVDLIAEIETIEGILRLRLSSIESSTIERRVIHHMAHSEKLCHYLHIPLQSGDDRTLAAMGRRYRTADYRAIVEHAVATVADLGLGTDIITGFPGETEAAFQNTVALVKQLPFNNLHVFPYSVRTGTRAADMPDQVSVTTRKQRARELIELGNTKRQQFAETFIGKPVSVLVEQLHPNGTATGWTREYLEAELSSKLTEANTEYTFLPTTASGAVLRSDWRAGASHFMLRANIK